MMLGSLRFGGSPQVPQGPGQNGQGTTTAAGPGVNAGTQTVLRTSGSSLGPSGSSFLWDSIRHGLGSFAGGSNVVAPMLVPQAAQKHLHSVIPGPAGGAVGTVPPSGVLPSYAPRAVASTAPSSSLPVIGPLPAPNASQGQFMPLVVVDYAPSTAAHPAVDVSTPGSLQAPKDIFDDPRSRHSSGSMSIDGEPSGIGRSPEGSLANPPMSFGAVPSQLAPLHVPLYYSSTSLPTVAFSGYGTPQFIAAPGSSAAPPSVAAYHPGQQPAFQYHIAGTRQSSGLNQLHFAAAGNPYMQLHYAHQPSLAHMPAAVLPIVLPHGQQMSAQDLAMLQHFLAQPNFGHPGVVGPPPFPYEAQRQASSGQLVAGHSGSILGANYVHASPASVNEHVIGWFIALFVAGCLTLFVLAFRDRPSKCARQIQLRGLSRRSCIAAGALCACS